jgi:hypothetical protein
MRSIIYSSATNHIHSAQPSICDNSTYGLLPAACDIKVSAGQVYIEPSYPESHDSMNEIDCFWTAVTDSAIQMFDFTSLT